MPSLTFLGSGDAFGSGGRLQTCMLLSGGTERVLIDCGTTSLVAMKQANVDPSEIAAVMVTHLHGDHFGGLPFLVLDGQFAKRRQPLLVAGPPGLRARVVDAQEALYAGSSTADRDFETRFVELAERERTDLGPVAVTAYPVVHKSGAPSYALRAEYAGKIVTYSGDTEWTDVLVEASAGADLFVCESYWFEKDVPYHLNYRTIERHVGAFSARRIILTHMGPETLSRLDDVGLDTAHDGMVVDL